MSLFDETFVQRLDDVAQRARALSEALDTSDVYGAREDRREDLECIVDRAVSGDELDAWILDGVLPSEREAA